MEDKKYQHYVPQFYLKNFSDNGKSVGMYIFETKKHIKNSAIRENFGKNYFYGKDKKIEEGLAKLEGNWAKMINKIIAENDIKITGDVLGNIVLLFFISDVRTIAASNNLNILINKMKKDITEEKLSIPRSMERVFDVYDLNSIMIEESLASLLLCDLKFILIKNNTKRDFITSDSVTVKYNQSLLESNVNIDYGYSSMGLQMFMPISPKLCLCLYDNNVYYLKRLRGNVLELNGTDQVLKFNRLFIYNSHKYLIFKNNTEEDVIRKQTEKVKKRYSFEPDVFESIDSNEKIYKIQTRVTDKRFDIPEFTIINNVEIDARNNKILDRKGASAIKDYFFQNNCDLPKEIELRLQNKLFYKK